MHFNIDLVKKNLGKIRPFLQKKFSLDILEKAIGHISNKQRLFSTDPSSPYKTDTIKEAKNLLKEANEILGNLKEVGSKEFKEDKNIILQKDSSTPESFYQELMEESFVRRLLSKKSNENKEKY